MALLTLPVEILQCIIKELPLERLRLLYTELPVNNPFKVVLMVIILLKISCGDRKVNIESSGFLYSNLLLLHQLAANNVAVQCLKIIEFDTCFALDLFQINQSHPEFLNSIPRIEYEGNALLLRSNSRISILDKIEKCHLRVTSTLHYISPNVKKVTLRNESFQLRHCIRKWPTSLTELVLDVAGDLNYFALPKELKSLSCTSLKYCSSFPLGLQSLNIINNPCFPHADLILPNLLEVLHVTSCFMMDVGKLLRRWPCNLKILNISYNPIKSLADLKFPPLLEELNVEHCKLYCWRWQCRFPKTAQNATP